MYYKSIRFIHQYILYTQWRIWDFDALDTHFFLMPFPQEIFK